MKEIIFQNKAIVYFKLNGKEERAVLLAKMFAVNGKPLEEIIKPMQTLADFIKINEAIQFDCHVYDKVGPGSGKDKCNFFVMKACKYGDIWPTTMSTHTTLIPAPPSRSGTGWVSEVTELHGVLTYTYNGVDQRVCKSSKYFFLLNHVYVGTRVRHFIALSSQTDIFVWWTNFSHFLGQKHDRKSKIEKF